MTRFPFHLVPKGSAALNRFLAVIAITVAASAAADEPGNSSGSQATPRQYTFAWPFLEDSAMAPRGGTTRGPGLSFETNPGERWEALREPGLSKRERDRRAILAMAGSYRASFDFIEVIGFDPGWTPSRPYQSWGTERVYVLTNEPDFVSLQHLLVMQILKEDGTLTDPMVVKHWRQDWRYEDRRMHEFRGHRRWSATRLPRRDVQGTWTQAVYQVDDSPRYEAYGRWEHQHGVSTWLSSETWRPLPRREFSVRDDYQVLIGTNRHTITPTGWVHEEQNRKVVLDSEGTPLRTIAKETGLNRYERLRDYDFSAGDAYLARTGAYWQAVRDAWRDIYRDNRSFTLASAVDEQPLFMAMFRQADALSAEPPEDTALAQQVRATLAPYLNPSPRS